jgi:hypothetical protein
MVPLKTQEKRKTKAMERNCQWLCSSGVYVNWVLSMADQLALLVHMAHGSVAVRFVRRSCLVTTGRLSKTPEGVGA